MIYFGDNQGTVHAVDAAGNGVWSACVGVPIRSPAVIARENRVLFGLDNGLLIALECDSAPAQAGWPKYLGTQDQSGHVLN